jgi:hypothetical protein
MTLTYLTVGRQSPLCVPKTLSKLMTRWNHLSWQNGFAERLIGSIRRECVDHIIVLGEMHLH